MSVWPNAPWKSSGDRPPDRVGLRLVVPRGRPTDSHKTVARRSRVPCVGFPGNPSSPEAHGGNGMRPLRSRLAHRRRRSASLRLRHRRRRPVPDADSAAERPVGPETAPVEEWLTYPAQGMELGLRLVVPRGRTRRAPELRRPAVRRVPTFGLARHPSRPRAVTNLEATLAPNGSAPPRVPTPTLPAPAALRFRTMPAAERPAARETRPVAEWLTCPAEGDESGLRPIVPWGRPTDSFETVARRTRVPDVGFPGNPSSPEAQGGNGMRPLRSKMARRRGRQPDSVPGRTPSSRVESVCPRRGKGVGTAPGSPVGSHAADLRSSATRQRAESLVSGWPGIPHARRRLRTGSDPWNRSVARRRAGAGLRRSPAGPGHRSSQAGHSGASPDSAPDRSPLTAPLPPRTTTTNRPAANEGRSRTSVPRRKGVWTAPGSPVGPHSAGSGTPPPGSTPSPCSRAGQASLTPEGGAESEATPATENNAPSPVFPRTPTPPARRVARLPARRRPHTAGHQFRFVTARRPGPPARRRPHSPAGGQPLLPARLRPRRRP